MTEQGLRGDLTSRRVIDVAIGTLMGLRGCTEREAFDDLVRAVRDTGVGLGAIAGGLLDLVGGTGDASPHRSDAMQVWGQLLTSRRKAWLEESRRRRSQPAAVASRGGHLIHLCTKGRWCAAFLITMAGLTTSNAAE